MQIMKNNFINISILLLFLSLVSLSCDDTILTDVDIPDSNVSYPEHIQPIFNNHCNNSTCHNNEDRAAGVSLTSYAELFSSPFLVIPYSPDESKLFQVIEGKSVTIMPPPYGNSYPLSDNQIEGIKTWIEEGAESD
jgi:hypothetical protein